MTVQSSPPTSSGPSDWGELHDLALLYLALAHGTDFEIDPAEQSTMIEKLQAWEPSLPEAQATKIFEEVMLTYLGGYSREMLDASVASLKDTMDKRHRIAVLNDLAELASADGAIVPGEVSFIQDLARFWEVDAYDA